MTLYLFKYCLPVLLGYTLFIGIAGRMNPFVKPEYPEERPSWFLGIWTGVSIALVLAACLQLMYSFSLEGVSELLPPTAFFMGVLLLPGFAGYSLYRRRVSRQLREASAQPEPNALKQRLADDVLWRAEKQSTQHAAAETRHPEKMLASPVLYSDDDYQHAPIVASFLDSADLQIMDTHTSPAANSELEEGFDAILGSDFDLTNETSLGDYLDDTVFEEFHYSDLDLESSELDATQLADMSTLIGFDTTEAGADVLSELELFNNEERASLSAFTQEELDRYSNTDDRALEEALQREAPVLASEQHNSHNLNIIDISAAMNKDLLEQRLSDEMAAHEETSRQLRITRKVLARLTPSAQETSTIQDGEYAENALVGQLKEELTDAQATISSKQSLVDEETQKRLQAENTCSHMRQELIKAKHDIRRSAAARAKALGTANKAIAFARQTLHVRALLEDELALARNTLNKRQETISSVIRELENEKERTQEEVSYRAQQLVMHEQQLKQHQRFDAAANEALENTPPPTTNGTMTDTRQAAGPDL